MSFIESLGKLIKGKNFEHPVSEEQRRWAFAAEERGELPKGTGKKWSRRVKGEKLPMSASAKESLLERTKHKTPPKEYREGGAIEHGDYADSENYKYPIDTETHVRAAISYFSKPKNANMYPPEKRKKIWGRIRSAAKKYGIEISEQSGPPSEEAKKSEESNMSEPLQKPDPNSMSKGMYSFYNQENAKEIPEMYLMDLVHAFIEEAFEHESKECDANSMNLEGQDRYAQISVAVYNELVQCAQFNPNLRRALEKYTGVLNEQYVRNYMESQGMIFTRNENYTADKMAQVAGYHPTKMAMSQYNPGNGASILEKSVEPMISLPVGTEDPMQQLRGYHQGLSKALRHEHLQSGESISPLKDTDPRIVDPNKA